MSCFVRFEYGTDNEGSSLLHLTPSDTARTFFQINRVPPASSTKTKFEAIFGSQRDFCEVEVQIDHEKNDIVSDTVTLVATLQDNVLELSVYTDQAQIGRQSTVCDDSSLTPPDGATECCQVLYLSRDGYYHDNFKFYGLISNVLMFNQSISAPDQMRIIQQLAPSPPLKVWALDDGTPVVYTIGGSDNSAVGPQSYTDGVTDIVYYLKITPVLPSSSDITSPEASTSIQNCTCQPGYGPMIAGQSGVECFLCEPGKYSVGGTMKCTNCSAGTFQNMSGQSVCANCSKWTYQQHEGRTYCDTCPNNIEEENIRRPTCKVCGAGEGTILGMPHLGCQICQPGYYKMETDEEGRQNIPCEPCPINTYNPDHGGRFESSCKDCPGNSTTKGLRARTKITDCECDPDYFLSTINGYQCKLCQIGSECTCGAGLRKDIELFFSEDLDREFRCEPCEVGSWSAKGQDNCTLCGIRRTTLDKGQDSADDCLCMPGYFSDPNEVCQRCDYGKFSGISNTCEQCPYEGQTTFYMGSETANDCVCDIGYELTDSVCSKCLAGKYKTNKDPESCNVKKYDDCECKECEINEYNENTGSISSFDCKDCPGNSSSPKGSQHESSCVCNKGFEPRGVKWKIGLNDQQSCTQVCQETKIYDSCASSMIQYATFDDFLRDNEDVFFEYETKEPNQCEEAVEKKFYRRCTLENYGSIECVLNSTYVNLVCQVLPQVKINRKASNYPSACKNKTQFLEFIELFTENVFEFCKTRFGDDFIDCDHEMINTDYRRICPCFTSGQWSCGQCALGFFKSDSSNAPCEKCPADTFADNLGQTSCTPCAPNSSAAEGSSYCQCKPGFENTTTIDGNFACSPCQPGQYKDLTGNSPCIACPAGTSNANKASHKQEAESCTPCRNGEYSLDGAANCTQCGANFYQPPGTGQNSSATCLPCPDHAESGAGSFRKTSCKCKEGHSGEDGETCTACPPGSYDPVDTSHECQPCAAGFFQNLSAAVGESACLPCSENTFSAENSSSCVACPGNASSPAESTRASSCACNIGFAGQNGSECGVCELGFYADETGLSDCLSCEEGEYSGSGPTQFCLLCAKGTYQNETNSSSCVSCPVGATTTAEGAEHYDQCECDAGFVNIGGNCTECAPGTYDDTSPDECKKCAAGKFNPDSAGYLEGVCNSCGVGNYSGPASAECRMCPENQTTTAKEATSVENCTCKAGYLVPPTRDPGPWVLEGMKLNYSTGAVYRTLSGQDFKHCSVFAPTYQDGNEFCKKMALNNYNRVSWDFGSTSLRPTNGMTVILVVKFTSVGFSNDFTLFEFTNNNDDMVLYSDIFGGATSIAVGDTTFTATYRLEANKLVVPKLVLQFGGSSHNQKLRLDVRNKLQINIWYKIKVTYNPIPAHDKYFDILILNGDNVDVYATNKKFSEDDLDLEDFEAYRAIIGGSQVDRNGYLPPTRDTTVPLDLAAFYLMESVIPDEEGQNFMKSIVVDDTFDNVTLPIQTFPPYTDCKGCGAGMYVLSQDNDEKCEACPAGKSSAHIAAANETFCGVCPENTYSLAGSARCNDCTPNSTSLKGSTSALECICLDGFQKLDLTCRPCSPGFYDPGTHTETCQPCPAGTNNPFFGGNSSACQVCPANTFSSAGSSTCSPCPLFSTSDPGATHRQNCSCDPGYGQSDCHHPWQLSPALWYLPTQTTAFKAEDGQGLSEFSKDVRISEQSGFTIFLNLNKWDGNSDSDVIVLSVDANTGESIMSIENINNMFKLNTPLCKKQDGTDAFIDWDDTWSNVAIYHKVNRLYIEYSGQAASDEYLSDCYLTEEEYRYDLTKVSIDIPQTQNAARVTHFMIFGTTLRKKDRSEIRLALKHTPVEARVYDETSRHGVADLGRTSCRTFDSLGEHDWVCRACQPGEFKTHSGNDPCDDCEAGTASKHYNASNTDTCAKCARGEYSFAGSSSCLNCPGNSSSTAGSVQVSDCRCNPGFTGADGGQCLRCSPGFYKEVNGSANCTACAAGKASLHYRAENASVCDTCLAGFYSAQGSAVCDQCPDNSSSPMGSTSNTDCRCDPGFTGANGAKCDACLPGYYKVNNGSAPCTSCTAGKASNHYHAVSKDTCESCSTGFYSATHSANCTECYDHSTSANESTSIDDCFCVPGFQRQDNAEHPTCEACRYGKFKNFTGSLEKGDKCVDCADGHAANTTGRTACTDCSETGQLSDGANYQCKSCDENKQVNVGGKKEEDCKCKRGYQPGSGGTSNQCFQCEAGFYKNVIADTPCEQCEPGKFSNSVGQEQCSPCRSGKYQPNTSATRCETCSIGTFSNPNAAICTLCRPGQYNNDTAQDSCRECEPGTISNASGLSSCVSCPPGSYQNQRGKTECIYCLPGSYQPENGKTSCLLCAPGNFSAHSGSKQCTLCAEGTFANDFNTSTCTACVAGTYAPSLGALDCLECQAGKFASASGAQVCTQCPRLNFTVATGSTQCQSCPPHQASEPDGKECKCDLGRTKDLATGVCEPCAKNLYKDFVSDDACKQCPNKKLSEPGTMYEQNCTPPIDIVQQISLQKGTTWISFNLEKLTEDGLVDTDNPPLISDVFNDNTTSTEWVNGDSVRNLAKSIHYYVPPGSWLSFPWSLQTVSTKEMYIVHRDNAGVLNFTGGVVKLPMDIELHAGENYISVPYQHPVPILEYMPTRKDGKTYIYGDTLTSQGDTMKFYTRNLMVIGWLGALSSASFQPGTGYILKVESGGTYTFPALKNESGAAASAQRRRLLSATSECEDESKWGNSGVSYEVSLPLDWEEFRTQQHFDCKINDRYVEWTEIDAQVMIDEKLQGGGVLAAYRGDVLCGVSNPRECVPGYNSNGENWFSQSGQPFFNVKCCKFEGTSGMPILFKFSLSKNIEEIRDLWFPKSHSQRRDGLLEYQQQRNIKIGDYLDVPILTTRSVSYQKSPAPSQKSQTSKSGGGDNQTLLIVLIYCLFLIVSICTCLVFFWMSRHKKIVRDTLAYVLPTVYPNRGNERRMN